MPVSWTLLVILVMAAAGYVAGRSRVLAAAGGDSRKLHSRTAYYGWNIALFTAVPALFLTALWLFAQRLAHSPDKL